MSTEARRDAPTENLNTLTLLGARVTLLLIEDTTIPRYCHELAVRLGTTNSRVFTQLDALRRRGWLTDIDGSYVPKHPSTRGTPRHYVALSSRGIAAAHAIRAELNDIATITWETT